MLLDDHVPDVVMMVKVLDACLESCGTRLAICHAYVVRNSFNNNAFVVVALLDFVFKVCILRWEKFYTCRMQAHHFAALTLVTCRATKNEAYHLVVWCFL
jgi:hypothetical protein